MSDDRFDAIVVGGGIAGTVTAYLLAKEGLEVMLVERGNYSGSKNVTGGRIYSHSLEKIMPNFAQEAPVERKITREKISLMTEESNVTLDFSSTKLGEQGRDSYSVLRGVFDQWLATKAEEAGVQIIPGIRVDDLILREGKVCGIIAGEDELEANVTILADGVNSLLAQKLGFRDELQPNQVAVGAKEIIELPAQTIEDRFNCKKGEGTSWLFAGTPSAGKVGGGFIYTNKESISLGVVSTLSELIKANKTLPQMLEDFKAHPSIEPLIKGGKMVEYSGHLVPEGGLTMVPKIIGHGVLVVGDAAGFCINLGYAVRGMDFAVGSAECAAKAVLKAKEAQDFSESSLQCYQLFLDESFVMKDLKQYRNFPHFLEETPRIFDGYPRLAADIMKDLFVVTDNPPQPLMKMMMKNIREIGLLNIAKDCWKGVRSL
ncbi:electron transfer flavoprotein-quinone oxidoreductase [Desulfitobacterium sp. LBE]|uniref:Electron-transferring-flavoprotein dehydrogenase n=2 Tax=root TaxID=1 RepID=B8G0W1_DESHD|nr:MULTISPECIES: FAD-dependent oxidoreductase [Desulfitobacterium]ACL18380.1 Electron-transferring-flavoprotein dehydrogenase [Desulfitobacterium hafniense DCB-2]MEA5023668.1 FAD-dependent oxidoreductase [Desulfitobacterium hafniense]TWH58692.1 electron transfer flavoprotein-quinone oxidoreductase [Desulfitobacterium sp. LBE]